ncbi:MAG: patatin-like phospholipase family protein [Bacteroidetes bacterium]|nr:patatin-like phospholipase family protein [Bacteroidota bacterium]
MSILGQTRQFFVIAALSLFFFTSKAQKVGVVLSGGAASGIAHIGVLKALEDNHIPIDYITGTSMGALVGSLYAIGYSPDQIEGIVKTEKFQNWSQGVVDKKFAYYFKRSDDDASWITYPLSLDSTSSIVTTLPTNLISPIAMDFGMMELVGAAGAIAGYNFDSLFIPFRCVASDVEKKESVVFRKGDLAQAVRASMSYPFYIKPILVDGKLLFDGGLYNNFPSNVMYEDFFPDFMIGSNVSGNNPPPGEDNLLSQIKCMLQSKSNYDILCEGGVIIQPKTDVGLFNFRNVQPLIDSGYTAAMRQMSFIKQYVERRTDSIKLYVKRVNFKGNTPKIVFDNIYIEGLNKKQSEYARKILRHKNKQVSLDDIKEGYFRLASDNKIKSIYPLAKYNSQTGFYDLYLRVKKERDLITYFGGNFSNRPISEGYIGLQYNNLGRFATGIMASAYFGKLYNSVQVKTRFDFPSRIPFYLEPSFTWSKWDYYRSSNAFLEDVKPAYLIQNEEYGNLNFGFPTGKKGRVVAGAGGGRITDRYYQTAQFVQLDTADRTDFDVVTAQAYYEINTLNRKQYANQGEYLNVKIRYVNGEETNTPGSTSTDTVEKYTNFHEWVVLKLTGEQYFNRRGTLKIGLLGEAVYSTQTLFNNYTSSILSSPAFQPTPDSKTVFLENYRTHKYLAGGIKFVVNVRKTVELRAEAYVFQPYQTLVKTANLKTAYGDVFALQHYMGTGAVVWHSPLGPISLSVNYYDQVKNPFSVLFHFGFIIFNKRAIE